MRSLVLVLGMLLAMAAQAVPVASVDRTRLAESETLTLTIRSDGRSDDSPDLKPLEQDFEVLSSGRSSNISIINGRASSYTQWTVSLAPRHAGEIVIPRIAIGSDSTAPLHISVTTDSGGSAGSLADRDVALEVVVDEPVVHVQQLLLVTVRLLHAVNLDSGATLEEPQLGSAVVRKLGEGSYEKTVGGRRVSVFERRYAVFPQASGELTVPSLRFDAIEGGNSWFDRFGGAGRRIRLRSDEQHVRVTPPEQGAQPWLPARLVTLVETWDRSPQELRVGESATRTLTLSANGLTAAQLPALSAGEAQGLRFYPDQPQIEDETRDEGITGTRTERSAVIPQRPGEMELPALRVRWWDTINARFDEAVVPARTIVVQPAAGQAATAATPTTRPDTATTTSPEPQAAPPAPPAILRAWQAACAVLALVVLLLLLQRRRGARSHQTATPAAASPGAQDEAALFDSLCTACRRNDGATAAMLLLEWSRAALDGAAPRALAELPLRLGEPALEAELRALLASRYAATPASWNGAALLARIESVRTRLSGERKALRGVALAPLYPQR